MSFRGDFLLITYPKLRFHRRWRADEPMFAPKKPTSPSWYLQPTPVKFTTWRCSRMFVGFCQAPPGFRCSCGQQLAGHDFGDENP